jgi:hypothetical protein
MKRDMDLVRKIVFAMEEHPHGFAPDDLTFEGYSREQVGYHLYLMIQAGLVDGEDASTREFESPQGFASSLAWQGHEFADAARSDTIWNKAKEQVKEKVGGVTLALLIEVLKHQAKQALGIP